MLTLEEAQALKRTLLESVRRREARGIAVGIGTTIEEDAFRIAVRLQGRRQEGDPIVQAVFGGVPRELLDLQALGSLVAFSRPAAVAAVAPTRPLTTGVSIGLASPTLDTGGTLGFFAKPRGASWPHDVYLVSNAHILFETGGNSGQAIVQPSVGEGGNNVVARSKCAVPLQAAGNVVDAALATLDAGSGVDFAPRVLPGGGGTRGTGVRNARKRDGVVMYGRAGVRVTGAVTAFSLEGLEIEYRYDKQTREFAGGQIELQAGSGTFGAAGDSGALVLHAQTLQPMGLYFASEYAAGRGYANPIADVLAKLDVEMLDAHP